MGAGQRGQPEEDKKAWKIEASAFAKNTFNPIRAIIETMELVPNPDKHMIALSIGDPTVFGNLTAPEEATEAVVNAVKSTRYNGYGPSTGLVAARQAVADYCTCPEAPLEPKDIILTSGCSSALDLCITVLANPGQNILIPRPGFPLYKTLAEGLGICVKHYDLVPEKCWEIDLSHLESLIDGDTVGIVVNNPSNPCGSVFSKEHLLDILAIAERHHLPIIADEIYDYFVFAGNTYYPMGSLSKEVPILSCGGLTKRYLVPGWRLGWILIQDKYDRFSAEIYRGLQCLSQRTIGSNTLVQGALADILTKVPDTFLTDTIAVVKTNADISYNRLSGIRGIHPIMPQGAMYMMVGIDMDKFPDFESDLKLVETLVSEQSVFCLPGKCFDYPNYVRIVLTVPEQEMIEACERMEEFFTAYYKSASQDFMLTKTEHLGQHILNREAMAIEVNGGSTHKNGNI